MCEHGDTVPVRVVVRREGHGDDVWKAVPIDRCIAYLVKALNDAALYTVASCCGHGEALGTIVLRDGRELLIRPYISGGEAWRYVDPNRGNTKRLPCTCESFGNGVIRGNGGLLPPAEGCPRHGPEPVFDIPVESADGA